MFASLHNKTGPNNEWLEFALQGADFLEKHGRDAKGNWYFSLTREGRPLTAPYNIFSDCFAAMAFGQLARAKENERYAGIAVRTFDNIVARSGNPKGVFNKSLSARPLRGFSLPMILCNLTLELEGLIDDKLAAEIKAKCITDVMDVFTDPKTGLVLENITADGGFSDSFEGRLINPGHGIEAMWFIMDLAEKADDRDLAMRAAETALRILEYGWDKEYGGIFYFMDIKGYPPQQLEWDQKLWWVHIEALIAMIKGYRLTGREELLDWFLRLHDYTWNHFPDRDYGEWFGYLNRRGEVLLDLKGGKWKGCFHIPRGLFNIWQTLEALA